MERPEGRGRERWRSAKRTHWLVRQRHREPREVRGDPGPAAPGPTAARRARPGRTHRGFAAQHRVADYSGVEKAKVREWLRHPEAQSGASVSAATLPNAQKGEVT